MKSELLKATRFDTVEPKNHHSTTHRERLRFVKWLPHRSSTDPNHTQNKIDRGSDYVLFLHSSNLYLRPRDERY